MVHISTRLGVINNARKALVLGTYTQSIFIHLACLMAEKEPVPITRGLEIQKAQLETIQNAALLKYKELTAHSIKVETELDIALSANEALRDNEHLISLFDKKHAIDEVGRALEDIILRGFEQHANLTQRWAAIEERLASIQESGSRTGSR